MKGYGVDFVLMAFEGAQQFGVLLLFDHRLI